MNEKMFRGLTAAVEKFVSREEVTKEELDNALVEIVSIANIIVQARNGSKQVAIEETSSPKPVFVQQDHCISRLHCHACRTQQGFRDSIRNHFSVPKDFDEKCPFGVVISEAEEAEESNEDCLEEPELPPVTTQIKNLAKAGGKVAKAALKGEQIKVEDEERKRRLEICKKCTLYIQSKKRCSHPECGCFVEKKAPLATEKCPEDFWANPEKQKEFNKARTKRLRAMQKNVVTYEDFIKHREALGKHLSKKSHLRKAFVRYDRENSSKKCKGCVRNTFTNVFSRSLIADMEQESSEVKAAIREILGGKEYIMNGNMPLVWDEIMGKA